MTEKKEATHMSNLFNETIWLGNEIMREFQSTPLREGRQT
jgi:hypothetical protein